MSDEKALEWANRTTDTDHKYFAQRAAERSGAVLVETILLLDQNPTDYRQALIDSFDKAVEDHKPKTEDDA